MKKWLKGLLYVLAVVIYFSYFPVITLGSDETMNFELSLPLVWLMVFDAFAVVMMAKYSLIKKVFEKWILKRWAWLLFPMFVTLSMFWSLNVVRGLLTVGVMWAVIVALISLWELREFLDEKFKKRWLSVFLGAGVFVCVFCVLQCVLDVLGVGREWTLMCEGCTYMSFGFPHPNGFAIEPQFMGNLLLAPTILVVVFYVFSRAVQAKSLYSVEHIATKILLFVLFTTTLFVTFSRGAIYAFIVAMIFATIILIKKNKKILLLWPMILCSFLLALNFQGILAAVSPTDDTYFTGITKALNHLSLGTVNAHAMSSTFDGYVPESTEIRKQLSRNGISVWQQNPKNMLIGVGIGGAGEAMFSAGLTGSPKEIIQNEYVSLLAETGVTGVVLLIVMVILVFSAVIKYAKAKKADWVFVIMTLMVAYGVTLVFFSGMANALQIYLLPGVLTVMLIRQKALKKV